VLASIVLGLVLLVGVSHAISPSAAEPGGVQLLQTLWADPIPSFLTASGVSSGRASDVRGLVPTDPPSLLAAPPVNEARSRGDTRAAAPVPATTSNAVATNGGGIPIRVFFSRRPDSESSFTAVFPVSRVSPDRAVATAALAALIAGPNAAERASGYYSELSGALTGVSSCAGRDVRVSVADGLATVRFCRAVTSAGIGQDARMRAELEATLRQFSTVRTVRLLTSTGHCLFDASGQDRCLGTPAASGPQPSSGARAR
jgi:hypothetical protein